MIMRAVTNSQTILHRFIEWKRAMSHRSISPNQAFDHSINGGWTLAMIVLCGVTGLLAFVVLVIT